MIITNMAIYKPAEDSYLLAETLRNYLTNLKTSAKDFKILDMGTGFGIQAETCKKSGFNNILTADINPEAVKHLEKSGFKSVQTDLFSKISKKCKFDLIVFNPPYLPEDKLEPEDSKIATTAGKKGYELIIKFLEKSKSYLAKKGVILILISSLSKPTIIIKKAKNLEYTVELLNKKSLFFEELYVYLLKTS